MQTSVVLFKSDVLAGRTLELSDGERIVSAWPDPEDKDYICFIVERTQEVVIK